MFRKGLVTVVKNQNLFLPKDLSTLTHHSALLRETQRSTAAQGAENDSLQNAQPPLKHVPWPLLPRLRDHGGRGLGRVEEPEVMGDHKEQCFQDTAGQVHTELTLVVTTYTRLVKDQAQ